MSIFQKNFYATVSLYKQENWKVFEEGPAEVSPAGRVGQKVVGNIIGINSSSISTAEIDQFRQGVEITQNKHTLGIVKISAGTPGHVVQPLSLGVSNLDLIPNDNFKELNTFNPVTYLTVMNDSNGFPEDYYTFPIVTGDTNHAENYLLNGIIEPLTIRAVASFFSIEFPFESHAIRGTLMGGNSDVLYGSSDQVVNIDYYPQKLARPKAFMSGSVISGSAAPYPPYKAFANDDWYLDAFETITVSTSSISIRQTNAFLDTKLNTMISFDDSKEYLKDLGISKQSHGTDMALYLLSLTSSLENYIPPGKKSATCGFIFDNAGYAGTDSIAFGGMTY